MLYRKSGATQITEFASDFFPFFRIKQNTIRIFTNNKQYIISC